MPKFLIDENLSPRLAVVLRSLGYDATAIRDVGLRGHTDAALVKWAKEHGGIIVTRDWEFGEVAFWQAEGAIGVVLLRTASQHVRTNGSPVHSSLQLQPATAGGASQHARCQTPACAPPTFGGGAGRPRTALHQPPDWCLLEYQE